ncbi:MAG: V-type ATPase subunit [Clostridia bacterium]|nr:V-type ATPase subunit [Clostridia bacterium]MBR0508874.1 V-type ATPase subunit [Clostridia bacterium]MBR0536951.1 V-type ATPase subunit [Clostridia bacterium]
MKDTEYTFAVARIRVNETRLMDRQQLNAAIGAADYADCTRRLREYGYDFSLGDAGALRGRTDAMWELLQSVLPDPHGLDSLLVKNDFHNLKVLLKALVSESDPDGLYLTPSIYDPEALRPLVYERKNDALPLPLQHADRSAYSILTKTRFAQLGDSVIDRAALEWQIKLAEKADHPVLSELAEADAALTDIKILYRCVLTGKAPSFMRRAVCACKAFDKEAAIEAADAGMDPLLSFLHYTPYADAVSALTESASAFEKYCDDRRLSILAAGKSEAFGILPLAAYYYAVQTEVMNVRILLAAKKNGLPEEKIRERMRTPYV